MTTALLCETVTGRSMAELVAARDGATHGDMVELRLDGVSDLDVAGALQGRRVPAVVTCRPTWEGGRFDGAEEDRARILATALDLGAEFVDVEWRAAAQDGEFAAIARRDARRVVVSSHDFNGVPSDLTDRVRAMRGVGAGSIKIAVAVSRLTETLALKPIAAVGDAVVIGMGEAGVPSRLLASHYGSRWTYAGHGVAPGQVPAETMADDFHFFRVGLETRIFGVVSTNAMHSLSPVMHNAAFEEADIDAVYVPLRASDFDDFLAYATAMGIEGASITIPFKLDALRAATAADRLTAAVGAANTLRRDGDNGWQAINTDVDGFLAPLDAVFGRRLQNARAAVLGAGGSARAVVAGLRSRGTHVTVFARRAEQAQELAQSLDAVAGEWPPAVGTWDILVNTTPLGGAGKRDESPLPSELVAGPLVYDLTYGVGPNALLRDAKAAGALTIDGLPMLVAQAERQFEWWTGQKPGPGVMAAAVKRRIERTL